MRLCLTSGENRATLRNLSKPWYHMSDRVGSVLATATLLDYGVITNDIKLVVDRSKLRRARNKYRK